MRRSLPTVAFAAVALCAAAAKAQQKVIPVVELTPASARSAETLGLILGLRQLPGGKVLIDDGGRRQIRLFDSTLTHSTVIIDSAQGVSNTYGPRPSPLIPWLADSSLWVDYTSSSFVVFDPSGRVTRTMAPPRARDLGSLSGGAANIDNKGRLLYVGPMMADQDLQKKPTAPSPPGAVVQPPDSAPIMRADFDTRAVETVGRIRRPSNGRVMVSQDDKGQMRMRMTINPLTTVDEWAVLSDGSIAFVRGHDYHIDWVHADGSTSSSAKLPFDWKRLTDDDKRALIDSARTAQEKAAADAKALGDGKGGDLAAAKSAMGAAMDGDVRMVKIAVRGDGAPPPPMPGSDGRGAAVMPQIEFVPLSEIADYYPAIRTGAAKADLDGNLWILPTTSAQSKNGELVYDVVNNKGELFERVRLPVGRSIAGFGRGGVVYLMAGDKTNGFFLERTLLIGVKSTPQ